MSTKKPISPANDAESKQHEHYYVAADPNSPEYITSRFQLIEKLLDDAHQNLGDKIQQIEQEMTLKEYLTLKGDACKSFTILKLFLESLETIEDDFGFRHYWRES